MTANKNPHTVEYWKNVAEGESRKLQAEAEAHTRTAAKLKDSKEELEHAENVRRGAIIALVFLFLLVAVEGLAILAICAERFFIR